MDLTTAEKKVLARSREVAKKYGEGNIDKIEQIDKKLRATPPQEREGLINDLKMLNKKRSMKSVSDSLNSIVSKYELKVSDPPTQTPRDQTPSTEPPSSTPRERTALRGAGAGAGAKLVYDKSGRASLASPREPLPSVKVKSVKKIEKKKEEKLPSVKVKSVKPSKKKPAPAPPPPPPPNSPQPPTAPKTEAPTADPIPEPAPAPAPPPTPEPVKTQEEPKPAGKVESIDKPTDTLVVDPNINPPSKRMGKSLDDLTVEEIQKDLDYFYKTYANRLKKLKRSKSKNIKVLKRFYKRVLALLRVEQPEEDKKNIGIVIKGSDYIKQKLKEIILENSIDGLSAKDMLINIEGKEDAQKADAGQYVFKTNTANGKTYAEGEPVERLIPKTEEEEVAKMNPRSKPKPNRLAPIPTKYRGQEVTAKKNVRDNPFLEANQPTIKLRKFY
jgi:hypothetical protein